MGEPITVLGAGSWGTALAILLARNGSPTRLWGHEPAHMHRLRAKRCNEAYLPGIAFPPGLEVETDLASAIAEVRDLLIVVPSRAFSVLLERIAALGGHHRLCWATKGFDGHRARLLHEVVPEVFDPPPTYAVLSGPTFATEVAAGLPTAITVATADDGFADDLSERLHNDRFRVYTAHDVIGVSIGGAAKNVYAIAAGIADGLGFGANTRAALITRALNEIMNLGVASGGQRATFMGLTGLGDLVLTCTDDQSRNRRFGLGLARGRSPDEALHEIHQVVEGQEAARHILSYAARHGVEMPIAREVYAVLYEDKSLTTAVSDLLSRERRMEAG